MFSWLVLFFHAAVFPASLCLVAEKWALSYRRLQVDPTYVGSGQFLLSGKPGHCGPGPSTGRVGWCAPHIHNHQFHS
ncbi:hypothetical protein I3843_03G259700 [Carya illinoinensis]|nr:hypothetical protein I3843_03G259700 [Carya illinoinensis]